MKEKENNVLKCGIVLVSPLPPPIGGIATWTLGFLRESQRNSIPVYVVDTKKLNGFIGQVKRTWKIICESFKVARSSNYAIYHINCSCSSLGMARDFIVKSIAKFFKKKVVVQFHCDIPYQVGNNHLKIFLFKLLCAGVEKTIVLNKNSHLFCSSHNIDCVTIGNFVDNRFLESEPPKRERLLKTAVFVGRVTKEKGILEIIESARELPDIHFVVVGPILISNLDVPKNVSFVGPKSAYEIIEILDKSDVFLLPSFSEGFSCSVVEAMSRGLPVIATKVGSNEELLGKSQGELLLDTCSGHDIAKAILKLKCLRDDCIAIGKKNRSLAASEYTECSIFNKICEVYKKL